jgi:hypothetical protein
MAQVVRLGVLNQLAAEQVAECEEHETNRPHFRLSRPLPSAIVAHDASFVADKLW